MNVWKTLLLFFALSVFLPAAALAQTPVETPSLAGDWLYGGRVIIIEQAGMTVRATWKQTYRDRGLTCSGLWFDGTITGNSVSGNWYPCGGTLQPLALKIVNADTLEVRAFQPTGVTQITYILKRIKQTR